MNKAPYIKISSIFIKSLIILILILFLPNMFIIANLFNSSKLSFSTDSYGKFIDKTIKKENGQLILNEEGKDLLKKDNLWIQFVDNSLNEVYSFNKPSDIPTSYTPINFIHSYKNDVGKSTVFMFETQVENSRYSYFLGFPTDIVNKHNITFNPTAVRALIRNLIFILIINLIIIFAFSYLYFSKKFGKPIQKIIDYIFALSKGDFNFQIDKKNLYKEVFNCLDNLRDTLKENKEKKELLDKSREKWISYVSHDMKTPLSSIKGFAELLKDDNYSFSQDEIKEYSNIMYDKANYMEDLINDLNFSYKLKNSAVELNLKDTNIVIFLKSLIDELLSDPKFEGQSISFSSNSEEIITSIDVQLMKRALSNLIINFLIYNDKDAKISINVLKSEYFIRITLEDNGRGMTKEDLDNIFEEYFRGTNTTSNPNGSGLGMAIANKLINLHKGKCSIKSEVSVGTRLEILLNSNP
ncbi:Signal transduction histidine kinase [Clostridium cavendishii DSM 21758]|uniref:histidine kinase n=1 Tax=Clostridium cavendishii DSM 21758 TaxID=1121302 RepID=A0A1M6IU77_9CLOT|nr:HAMP domain-containing sensor histidine kinase [Clostridium cavendishii]SHJ37964.1 Signal transduction histidine kinase [Clostridium cavendishii DSM 21758]